MQQSHNLPQDVKLNKHMLVCFDKEEKWLRRAKFSCNLQQLSLVPSLFYHPSGSTQASKTAKTQMGQRQHEAEKSFTSLENRWRVKNSRNFVWKCV